MTVLGVTAALVAGLWTGYLLGRRSGRSSPSWKHRTSRPALARQAVSLIALVAVSQLQRSARRGVPAPRRRLPWPIGR